MPSVICSKLMTPYYILTLCSTIESPRITYPSNSDYSTTIEKTNVSFTCNATGSPPPIISFLYEGIVLLNTLMVNRVSFEESLKSMSALTGLYEVSRTFTLHNTVGGDSGNYTCLAAADIPGIGVRNDSVLFLLTVFCESVFYINITKNIY